jgi:RNA polymerase sigma-70 factor, ECF subfamily
MADSGDITQILERLARGDAAALEELAPRVYVELRKLAAYHLRRESPAHTLQPSALVNEAYLRLARGGAQVPWSGRAHFFAVASNLMRRILVDHARAKRARKRGAGVTLEELDQAVTRGFEEPDRILIVDEALGRLAAFAPRQCRIVEMRFFAGLTEEEIGEVLGLSARTVKRDWAMARAWLQGQFSAGTAP